MGLCNRTHSLSYCYNAHLDVEYSYDVALYPTDKLNDIFSDDNTLYSIPVEL